MNDLYQPDRRHDHKVLGLYAQQECADLLLGIILACDQRCWWLARIMGRAK